jgi:hypothetical protein
MCELGKMVDSLSLGGGLAVAIYHDPESGQWTAKAQVPTPIGPVEVSAKAREDVVTAATKAARELWCRLMGMPEGCADPSDVFLSGAEDAQSHAAMARAKVTETVTKIARAASLLHRARMGDPSARAGVAQIVQLGKQGHPQARSAWKTLQTLAGLSQIAKAFVPEEVTEAAYAGMVAGYSARPTLDMIAGPDGSYRLRRRPDGSAWPSAAFGPSSHVGASLLSSSGRYGLALRW